MTLRLILIRHAKSSWEDPAQPDRERPLNARGRDAASMIGRWLAAQGHVPQEVLVSPSQRTRETLSLLDLKAEVRVVDALYHASPDAILQALRGGHGKTVALIGHNPGIAAFANAILAEAPTDPDVRRYPTCATLIVEFEAANWASVTFGSGRMLDFITPRRLAQ